MRGERGARLLAVAGHEVEHARRQPGLVRQRGEADAAHRGILGRLEDRRVAGGERRPERAAEHRGRVVAGDDDADDAARLALHGDLVLGEEGHDVAGDLVAGARVELEVARGDADVGEGLRPRLAGVLGFDGGELLGIVEDEPGQAVEDAAALEGGEAHPFALEGLPGGGDGGIDLGRAPTRDGGEDLAVRRRAHVDDLAGGRAAPVAADEDRPAVRHLILPFAAVRAYPSGPGAGAEIELRDGRHRPWLSVPQRGAAPAVHRQCYAPHPQSVFQSGAAAAKDSLGTTSREVTMAEGAPALPLSGINVVSIEQAIAAPLASRHLADWGARVIKIERPDRGDFCRDYDAVVQGLSSQFVWTNRSKESLALDIKSDLGKRALAALLERADVFVQNLAPGAARRQGLDAAALVARHPRLIACDVSGYGANGPYSDRKAYDLLVQCEAGLLSINGTEREMAKGGLSIVDIATGMYVLNGVLMALYNRERTGKGMAFEVSLFDSITEWMSYPALYTEGAGRPLPRTGTRHATIAPYGPFRAGDGKDVFFGVQNEREWQALCRDVLGDPALAADPRFDSNPRRVANRDALQEEIETRLAGTSSEAVRAQLDRTRDRQCAAQLGRGLHRASAAA